MERKNRIAELRKTRGYSQERLAQLVGVAQNTISNWEQGKREPDYTSLKKLSYYLDCTVDYLLGGSDFGFTYVYSPLDFDGFSDYCAEKLSEDELDQLKNLLKLLYMSAENAPDDPKSPDILTHSGTLIMHYFLKLNDKGRKEATKRTRELALLSEYSDNKEEPTE